MQILFDHQIFSQQQYGGISRYFYELARHITFISNHHIKIFAPFHFNNYIPLLPKANFNGLKLPRLPIILGPFALTRINTVMAHASLRPNQHIDVFHETYYSISDYKPRSAKRIITVYDMTHEKFADTYFKGNILSQQKAHAIRRADHIICISKNTQRDLIDKLAIPEDKTSVTYLSYSLTKSKTSNMQHPTDKPFILYIGQRGKYKNFIRLLNAYAGTTKLKDNFSLVCFGGGSFSSYEKSLIKKFTLTPHDVIQLSGNDHLLSELYSTAKVFIYPSLYEGFGIPLLEAMSLGCPVACSRTSSFPEVVDNAAELFNPEEESDICSAIERIVFNPARARLLKNRGYQRIKQFSWQNCAQQTLKIYEKVVNN